MRVAVLIGVLAAGGCVETKVIRNDVFMSGVPGVETQMDIGSSSSGLVVAMATTSEEMRAETETGETVLISRSIRDLIIHIAWCLENDEAELFGDWLLSEQTKQEFIGEGYEPADAYWLLKQTEAGVRELLERMPQGEYTPGLFLEPVGDQVFRLRVPGGSSYTYTFIDAVQKRGFWTLRWFG